MTTGLAVGAEHAGDREAVDVGVDDADRVAAGGEGDGEVGGDARLADAALAGRDQQRPGPRPGLGERDRPALGVALRLAVHVAAAVALQLDAQRLALLVAHHGEVDADAGDAVERRRRRASTRLRISFFSGQPGTVRATRIATLPSAAGVDRRGPCRGRRSSGAARDPATGRRASMIWSRVTGMGTAPLREFALRPIGRIPAWPQPTADAQGPAFTAAVSAITDAFGDPTRRRIYLFTRDHGGADGVTASAVAAEVGVHPNVARHHLDKLAAGGYVEVVSPRRAPASAAPGARRSATSPSPRTAFDADVPVRSDDLVLALLGRALDRLPARRGRGDGRGGRRRRTAGRWPPGSPATPSPPGSGRCARRCRPSPTP